MTSRPRVLIAGVTGMLGHKLWQVLPDRFDVWGTTRQVTPPTIPLFDSPRILAGVDAGNLRTIERACDISRPDVIVNCIGLVKQLPAAVDPIAAISLNAVFPHQLSACGHAVGARVIHISTDCVFSGSRGRYVETDFADADDLYGRTKYLGELTGPNTLTLRTSIIGRELAGAHGLVEWFLAQRGGRAAGYRLARFSGLSTRVFARVIGDVIERRPDLTGVYHVAGPPIAKVDLLSLLNDALDLRVRIEPTDAVRIDRTLDGTKFAAATAFIPPSWDDMVTELAGESRAYDEWRQVRV